MSMLVLIRNIEEMDTALETAKKYAVQTTGTGHISVQIPYINSRPVFWGQVNFKTQIYPDGIYSSVIISILR